MGGPSQVTPATGAIEIQDAIKKLQELDMNTIETYIDVTNNWINNRQSSPVDRMTLQSIRGSYILEKIQSS